MQNEINENYYPIWHTGAHGPACTVLGLAELYASNNRPLDVISFIDEENLVYRLRQLGWADIADSMERDGEGDGDSQ